MSDRARIKRINGRLYDTMTPNKSFLKLAKDLKTLGIKNWYFMLEIFDISLCTVDPHAIDKRTGKTSLTKDEMQRIHIECRRNPWYYLREVVRIEDPGNPNGVPYKANRGNIAQAWLFLHGIDSWLCLPRQQGKTQSCLALLTWVYSYGTTDTGMIFINKSGPDAKENLARFGTTIRLLPEYMQFKWIEDDEGHKIKEKDNVTERKHPVNGNRIIIKASATSLDGALKLARGLTTAIQHFDEPEFTSYIKTIVENSVSTYETAASRAKENHAMYGRCFTCTPGDLDSAAGLEAQELLSATIPWTDKLYDMTTEEMEQYAGSTGGNHIVYIEFQWFQIGLTQEWLKYISEKIHNPLTVRREILLQRLHGSSQSPYPREDIEYIMDRMQQPIDELMIFKYYKFDIYEELDPHIPYIVGVDCSTGTVKDTNAITILNPYTVKPAAEFGCNYIGETKYEQLIIELVTRYIPRAIVCIERNHVGDGILDHLLNSKISSRLYYDKSKDLQAETIAQYEEVSVSMLKKMAMQKMYYGVFTEKESRNTMFTILARHVSEFKDNFVTHNITTELSALIRKPSGKIEAGTGFHDDAIMSYLICLYVYYHGNNLSAFGFDPGKAPMENLHDGLKRESASDFEGLLPDHVIRSMVESEKATAAVNNYESIFRQALAEAQTSTRRMLDSSLNVSSGAVDSQDFDVSDDDGVIGMDFFDEINGLGSHKHPDDPWPF